MQEEKWERCAENMQKKADELGAKLVIQSANGDEELQYSQCENLITQGVDALKMCIRDRSRVNELIPTTAPPFSASCWFSASSSAIQG